MSCGFIGSEKKRANEIIEAESLSAGRAEEAASEAAERAVICADDCGEAFACGVILGAAVCCVACGFIFSGRPAPVLSICKG
jgi:hypothetical protein